MIDVIEYVCIYGGTHKSMVVPNISDIFGMILNNKPSLGVEYLELPIYIQEGNKSHSKTVSNPGVNQHPHQMVWPLFLPTREKSNIDSPLIITLSHKCCASHYFKFFSYVAILVLMVSLQLVMNNCSVL